MIEEVILAGIVALEPVTGVRNVTLVRADGGIGFLGCLGLVGSHCIGTAPEHLDFTGAADALDLGKVTVIGALGKSLEVAVDAAPAQTKGALEDDDHEAVLGNAVGRESQTLREAAAYALATLHELLLELLALVCLVRHLRKAVHHELGVLLGLLEEVEAVVKEFCGLTGAYDTLRHGEVIVVGTLGSLNGVPTG